LREAYLNVKFGLVAVGEHEPVHVASLDNAGHVGKALELVHVALRLVLRNLVAHLWHAGVTRKVIR
jgi:hypothetical protein